MAAEQAYEELLKMSVVAVVGCSIRPERASHQVAKYLLESGFRVIPVNPKYKEVLGEICFPDLKSVPDAIEVVDVFRRAEEVPQIVDDAIAVGAKGLWLQDGIDAPAAADKARRAGLKVVVDDCLMRQHLSRFGR